MITLQHKSQRIGVTFESMTWFLVFTAIGTVIGAVVYDYVAPYLPILPNASKAPINPVTPTGQPSPFGAMPRLLRWQRGP